MAVEHDTPKLVHHRCGYPFLTRVIGRFSSSPALVVEYRDGRPSVNSIPLYHCPRCSQELRLWWDGSETQVYGGVDEELREDETPLALP